MKTWQRWLSYMYPIGRDRLDSPFQKGLEISWQNGRMVLDGPHANFSFGALHRVMRKALSALPASWWPQCNATLLLGVGGGSAVQLLRETYQYHGPITAVDIDPIMPELCRQYFDGPHWEQVSWVVGDAQHQVPCMSEVFDLIIVDIFVDIQMPDFVFTSDFLFALKDKINSGGYLIFNTIIKDKKTLDQVETLLLFWKQQMGFSCRKSSRVAGHNTLIWVHRGSGEI